MPFKNFSSDVVIFDDECVHFAQQIHQITQNFM